jgi:hypothetical protein
MGGGLKLLSLSLSQDVRRRAPGHADGSVAIAAIADPHKFLVMGGCPHRASSYLLRYLVTAHAAAGLTQVERLARRYALCRLALTRIILLPLLATGRAEALMSCADRAAARAIALRDAYGLHRCFLSNWYLSEVPVNAAN